MHGFKGERTLMRIHIGEHDKFHGKPLYKAIVELLRQRHYAGVTVLRAIMGFGASSRLYKPNVPPDERTGSWPIEPAGRWQVDPRPAA
jgi:hypothetical protein